MNHQTKKQIFSESLLSWYQANKRDLPWRKSRDPYQIWVSEIMLQQTRVETVIPYFQRFMEKFPTIESLATAKEEEVLKMWEGLGYYSRARNLQTAVKEVYENYGGTVPDSKDHIARLKGVGPYTTGAILSIAYNQPEPAVDGNVMRVLSRYFLLTEDITKPRTRKLIEELAQSLIIEGQASHFNQALMEFGATLCTPKSPYCLICPVLEHCGARQEGLESSLPIKSKLKAPREELRIVAWIEGEQENQGKLLFRQRPQQGLLAQMWEMPHIKYTAKQFSSDQAHQIAMYQQLLQSEGIELHKSEDESDRRNKQLESNIQWEWLMDTEHVFSHIHWKMKIYRCKLKSEWLPYHYRWISKEELDEYALPTAFRKLFSKA